MTETGVRFTCSGCGATLPSDSVTPFVCPNRAGSPAVDHLIERRLPALSAAHGTAIDACASHPFVRYRRRLASYAVARAAGWSDARFTALVGALDAAVAAVDGHGFERTAWRELPVAVGLRVQAKLELTGVAGSHKARHLFGLMLWLRVQEALGRLPVRPPLAIASCGNAALAAAVVARAATWPIRVFVPEDADATVVQRLHALDAEVVICPRAPGTPGDPTVLRFRAAVAAGALPFCCQGTDNGLTIEGGETLGWELAEDLAGSGGVDSLWVQVGGGALGAACWRGLRDARDAGVGDGLPRLMTVQTAGAWPLGRAWLRFVAELLQRPDLATVDLPACSRSTALHPPIPGLADDAADQATPALATIAAAAHARWAAERAVWAPRLAVHWRSYMAPWPTPPSSVAHGILDDETYDGRALVEAMLDSGGWPVIASEPYLARTAADLATHAPVTPTGAAGLAGLRQMWDDFGSANGLGTRHAVLLTGLDRAKDDSP